MSILALDLGLKRIGVAYSPDGSLALTLNAVIRRNRDQAAAEVRSLLAEYAVDRLVVGVPIGGRSEEVMRLRALHFVSLLGAMPLSFQDESDSSIEAAERSAGMFGRAKDGRLDSLAAQIILERFLADARR